MPEGDGGGTGFTLERVGAKTVLKAIVNGFIVLTILAAFAPVFFGEVQNLTSEVGSSSTGSPAADAFLDVIPIIIGIGFALLFLGVAVVLPFRHRGS